MNFILFLWFSPSGFIYPYLSSFLSRFSIFVYPRLHVHYSLNTFIFLSPSLYMCISHPNLSRYYSLLSSSFLLYLFLSLSLSLSLSFPLFILFSILFLSLSFFSCTPFIWQLISALIPFHVIPLLTSWLFLLVY